MIDYLQPLDLLRSDGSFAFATGSVRAREGQLLDDAALSRLIDSADAAEAWRLLADAAYPAASEFPPEGYETLLTRELHALYSYVRFASGKPELTDLLAWRFDYHNLKVFLKAKCLNEPSADAIVESAGLTHAKLLEAAVSTGVFSALPAELSSAAQRALAAYERQPSPQMLDFSVDRAMFEHLQRLAASPFLRALVATWCDLANLKILLRAKVLNKERDFVMRAQVVAGHLPADRLTRLYDVPLDNWADELRYTPYGGLVGQVLSHWQTQRDFAVVEKLCDEHVLAFLRVARWALYGVEPLVAYALAKEAELRNIRLIMVGKLNGIVGEVLRERVRKSYG